LRFFQARPSQDEHLLWTRDVRFANRLLQVVPGIRRIDLESGVALVGPSAVLTDALATRVAHGARDPEFGLVRIDPRLPESDRYLHALAQAVQLSGLADRIGMAQSTQVVQTKLLDLFFALSSHSIAFQPIVRLQTGELEEWECLFRPEMGRLPTTIGMIVQAAIETERARDLDAFILRVALHRLSQLRDSGQLDLGTARFALNVTPATLLDPSFEPAEFADRVREAGLRPSTITLECTEQQAVADQAALRRRVTALRRLGFGFAVDDAGAGYASFSLIAALRPSVIKIDREIVHRVARDDAKQALIEAFVSFARRLGARLIAEGIETRADLRVLRDLGVEFGQGYLLGRPAGEPLPPRPTIQRLIAEATAGLDVAAEAAHPAARRHRASSAG
jgi:EAL domain-containing protein (putative c-di-GMP-specific phosphodiesterase class I)